MFTNRSSKLALTVLALLTAVTTASFAFRSSSAKAERAYDTIEQLRAERRIENASASSDYDLIEQVRNARSLASSADHSFDAVEAVRLSRGVSNDGYDQLESIRNGRSFPLPVQAYELVELVRLERSFKADRAYDSIETIRLMK